MKKLALILLTLLTGLNICRDIHSVLCKESQNDLNGAVMQQKEFSSGTYSGVLPSTPHLPVLKCKYYDEAAFRASFRSLSNVSEQDSEEGAAGFIQGGILPHHLVAAPMIADFFTKLKDSFDNHYKGDIPPITVIILAPNHKRIGDSPIQTGPFSWNTPFGTINADEDMTGRLINKLGAGVNSQLLEEEHSISALIPYISYSFPEAKVVPILIHGNMKREACKKLASFISEEAKSRPCLVIASIDFSHNLLPKEALERDEITRNVIETRDYETLYGMGNEYLDAPPTLAAFLMSMDLLGSGKCQLISHSEASQFLKHYVKQTTSYMTYFFSK